MISPQDEKTLRELLSLATEPEDALTYDALRGFLFGVAITPDVVMPREWLPMVFGEKMITAPAEREVKLYFETLARVINNFIERFNENGLSFPFDMENLSEETTLDVIQDWAYGLNEALTLRAGCWYEFMPESVPEEQAEEYDDELLTALSVIHGLARPDEADELFTTQFEEDEERSERLLASLFVMLPTAVVLLLDHAAALDQDRREALRHETEYPPPAPKAGRNDPCPCGSGKKYKKCCRGKVNFVPF